MSSTEVETYVPGRLLETIRGGFQATALEIPPDLSYDLWEKIGQGLGKIDRSNAWWVGDWLNFGERAFGEKYSQAMEDTGLAEQTLTNYAYVAANVPPDVRRAELSWSHHLVVAPLDKRRQRRWLDHAVAGGWSVADLKRELAKDKSSNGHVPGDTKTTIAKAVRALETFSRQISLALVDGELEPEKAEAVLQAIEGAYEALGLGNTEEVGEEYEQTVIEEPVEEVSS